MNYIVMETQTTNGTTAIVTPIIYADKNQAESKFHQILAAAAVSNVQKHTAMILTDDGNIEKSQCYTHE